MPEIERIGNWPKSPDSFGDPKTYSSQAERYAVDFLRHYFHLESAGARHLGGGDEPDGILSLSTEDFATVEVRLFMENFEDTDRPRGSGWPQVMTAIDGTQSIPLDSGLGTWALWVSPNAGAIRRLLQDPLASSLLSNFIRQILAENAELPIPRSLSALADVQEIFPLHNGFSDECVVIPHVQPYGGFFSTSLDHISSYMQQRIAEWTESSPTRRSSVEKWAERAGLLGAREIHAVSIFENAKEWMRRGIMYQLMDTQPIHPSTPLDLTGLPPLKWSFWLLLRNPNNGDFHKAFNYVDSKWTVVVE